MPATEDGKKQQQQQTEVLASKIIATTKLLDCNVKLIRMTSTIESAYLRYGNGQNLFVCEVSGGGSLIYSPLLGGIDAVLEGKMKSLAEYVTSVSITADDCLRPRSSSFI